MKKVFLALTLTALVLTAVGCSPAGSDADQAPSPNNEQPVSENTTVPADEEVQPEAPQLTPFKFGMFNYISFAPIYIAYAEGYFAEFGLDVELIDFGSASNDVLPALIDKQLDATGFSAAASIYNAVYDGNNIKLVADKGYIQPDSCITDAWVGSASGLADGSLAGEETIAGKTVILFPGGTFEFALDKLLERNGLTQSDITPTTVFDSAARIEALRNGSADISLMSEPWISTAVESGAGEVWVPFSEIIPSMSIGMIVFGPSILEDNPDLGTAFMAGYLKGVEQFNQGATDRNIELIAEFTRLDLEPIASSCWTSFQPDGYIVTEYLMEFQDWALEKDLVNGSVTVEQLWTDEFLQAAEALLSED